MSLDMFLQHFFNALTLGSLYGLIAIGYTMVYGILRLINFAHGDILKLGAYFVFYGTTIFFLPWGVAVVVAMLMLMSLLLMSVVLTAAAVVAVFMLMFLMLVVMLMPLAMGMGRHMPHRFMVMILAAMAAGTPVRMIAVILSAADTPVDMTEGTHVAAANTHVF